MKTSESEAARQEELPIKPDKEKIRVIIADNQPVVLEGLRKIIDSQPDLEIVGEAASVSELLSMISRQSVDVVVVEVSMGKAFPIRFIQDIRSLAPATRILVLSSFPEDFFATRLFAAGIDGYLRKRSETEEILKAVRKLAHGGRYASEQHLEALTAVVRNPASILPHQLLSNREFQILQMIGKGQTTKEIAIELSISAKTVTTHKMRILGKMKMKNTAELVRYALSRDYIE